MAKMPPEEVKRLQAGFDKVFTRMAAEQDATLADLDAQVGRASAVGKALVEMRRRYKTGRD